MKLTYSQLQSVTVGATRLEETEDGVRFWRMTEAQIQHYYDRGDEHQALNGIQSAGVRLSFVTNSCFVSFSAKLLPDLSGYHAFDVWVDGVMIAHFGKENVAPENCRVELAEGEKLVEADTVFMASGLRPRSEAAEALRFVAPVFRLVGDCLQPGQLFESVTGGRYAGREI